MYSWCALVVPFILAFRKEWLIIFVVWWITGLFLLMWFRSKVKKAVRENGTVLSPEQQSVARKALSDRMKRPIILAALSGILLLFTGMYNSVGYAIGGFVLILSLLLYFQVRRMR